MSLHGTVFDHGCDRAECVRAREERVAPYRLASFFVEAARGGSPPRPQSLDLIQWINRRGWNGNCPNCQHDLNAHKLSSGSGECFGYVARGRNGLTACNCAGPHIEPFR